MLTWKRLTELMKFSRKTWVGIAVAAGALGLLVAGAVVFDKAAEEWMAVEFRALVAENLHPTLEFDDLDYRFPLSVTLTNARLIADGTEIISVEELSLGLAEIPSSAEPLRIESIEAEGLTVQLVDAPGGFKGFSNFLTFKTDPKTSVADVFVLRHLELGRGSVVWVPKSGDAMRVDDVQGDADIRKVGTSEYEVSLHSAAGGLVQAGAQARLDLDTFHVELAEGTLKVEVTPDTRDALPPGLRDLMSKHQVGGTFDGQMSGSFSIDAPDSGDLTMHAELKDFTMQQSGFSFPVKTLSLDARLHEKAFVLKEVRMQALGGEVTLEGRVALDKPDTTPAELKWNISGLALSELAPGSGAAGRMSGSGTAKLDANQPGTTLSGGGRLKVHDGRLLKLPGIEQMAKLQNKSLEGRHEASARFSLHPNSLRFSELTIETAALGFRGEGTLGFDGSLDLLMKVGPMQKVDAKGFLGRLARIGGSLVPYKVTGSLSDPKVRPRPLGIGAG